ncbi:MAG: S46 family peptidase, partial [Bergeyella zoohelcum]|nr:S46 family peptidase [Bergeyella zoohelcum]
VKNPEIKRSIAEFNKLYNEQAPYALHRAYYNEIMRNAETLTLANIYLNYLDDTEAGKSTPQAVEQLKNRLKAFYKDYDAELDAKVTAKLLTIYAQQTPKAFLPDGFDDLKNEAETLKLVKDFLNKSVITGKESVNSAMLDKDIDKAFANPDNLRAKLLTDPFMLITSFIKENYKKTTATKYAEYQKQIDVLQKKYMAQQMATDTERPFFPDANSTLRVAYGKVAGSNPKDALYYGYQTHLSGVMEKYIPNDYEFDVPKKLIDLYQKKDYGIYKNATGEVPVNFTATNHTTGGNSGSPVLDAQGNLIGLNFDRQWEGTMSDINFDPRFSRNIMVDTKYILFVIDKFAGAKWLLEEMKIVK